MKISVIAVVFAISSSSRSNVAAFQIGPLPDSSASTARRVSMLQSTTPEVESGEETKKWKESIKELCAERNIPFQKIKNARDLNSCNNSPIMPNRVYRMGKVTDATEQDMDILFDELNVRTLVDLRSRTELRDEMNGVHAHHDEEDSGADAALSSSERDVFEGFHDLTWSERKGVRSLNKTDEVLLDESRKERHFVSLMDEIKYVRGTLSKLRKRDIAKAVLKSPGAVVSKRVRGNVKSIFLDEINAGGLPLLNELVLKMAGPGIKYVLDLCADKSRHPVAFYCTAGKDRTGILASIILSVVGVPDEDIVEDYSLSANVYAEMNDHKAMVGALSQRNLDAKTFLGAPPQVMRDTLTAIRKNYGSVEAYMDSIGFGPSDREKLKKALLL
uniref:Tyrosine specific protein phosphatases domain-containing protein n=1 Tax=Leptocylindrus danicus TaxID=163516 RepID=A0A7S2NYU5_9STRA|mmetsp:Transcript_17480/g.26053  ORF Transcript_17480/g.26053 Transcript_17480/m.26053 type:complete len:388 (+) Transcript_17480:136-1299(+)|eukprot:CAMPEP_0116020510 /NCGR_PEP_ID=MMETSP0321-20121206/9839_1 /TAXON_ID=163516 /ORGANISM="Leptocylindrus danicus var. danicus, Strain B650" /LENGTH=387 /DNA_ID=CAMNT_0003491213 /DNA_START=78 /DNA_END=1241 /DNA_ORIENTATION=+